MSEAGFLYVTVKPDARNFGADLDRQIKSQSKGVQGILSRTGLGDSLKDYDKVAREAIATQGVLSAAEDRAAESTKKLSNEHENFSVHAHRASIAGIGIRSSMIGIGAAALIGTEGLREIGDSLKVVGERADTVTGSLRNAAAAATSGNFAEAAKQLGNAAGADLNRSTADAASSALATDKQRQDAVALAKELLDLREQTAKAEGTVGTAAGRTRYELEKQLKAAQAAYNALAPNLKRVAAGQFDLNPDLSNKAAIAPTDASRNSDFGLQSLRAQQSKTLADDKKLYDDRRKFLEGQIHYLEAAGAHTQASKDRLSTLYGQLDSVEGQIATLDQQAAEKRAQQLQDRIQLAQTSLEIESANARTEGQQVQALRDQSDFARKTAENKNLDAQSRAEFELQAAQADKQIYDIGVQAAERAQAEREKQIADAKQRAAEAQRQAQEELQARRAAYRADISLDEQKLGIQVQRASLTTKSLADDRKAINAQIAFYRKQASDHKLTDSERLNFRSQQLSAQQSLKSLNSTSSSAPASRPSDFFNEASKEFRSFGSNIATGGGVLSGQDARAAFAAKALSGNTAQAYAQAVERKRSQENQAQLSEAQKQTALLTTIAGRLTYSGATRPPAPKGIANARRGARVVGVN